MDVGNVSDDHVQGVAGPVGEATVRCKNNLVHRSSNLSLFLSVTVIIDVIYITVQRFLWSPVRDCIPTVRRQRLNRVSNSSAFQ